MLIVRSEHKPVEPRREPHLLSGIKGVSSCHSWPQNVPFFHRKNAAVNGSFSFCFTSDEPSEVNFFFARQEILVKFVKETIPKPLIWRQL